MIRACIIDDEMTSVAALQSLVREFCDGIKIVSTADSVSSGIESIRLHEPDLVFLDITMADGDGFGILTALPEMQFKVIFTTAHHEFALKAFEFSALHYLLKPIDPDELRVAITRYTSQGHEEVQYDIFQKGLNSEFHRMALPSLEGITFIDLDDIIRCEAADSYTIFFLKDKSKIIVSKSLNKYERLLEDSFFCRIHDKHLINLKFVSKYIRGKGGNVLLSNGFAADVSVRRKEEFLQKIAKYTRAV